MTMAELLQLQQKLLLRVVDLDHTCRTCPGYEKIEDFKKEVIDLLSSTGNLLHEMYSLKEDLYKFHAAYHEICKDTIVSVDKRDVLVAHKNQESPNQTAMDFLNLEANEWRSTKEGKPPSQPLCEFCKKYSEFRPIRKGLISETPAVE
jgi:hypothetical protein